MAVPTALTRLSAATDNNSYESKGLKATLQAYAATSAWVGTANQLHIVYYATLTGAMTINATVTDMLQTSEVIFVFDTDGTQRIVTFGTNFLSSGTLTIPASKGAVVRAVFDGTNLRVYSREIHA
jgi:hypothetical protein